MWCEFDLIMRVTLNKGALTKNAIQRFSNFSYAA